VIIHKNLIVIILKGSPYPAQIIYQMKNETHFNLGKVEFILKARVLDQNIKTSLLLKGEKLIKFSSKF